MYLLVLIVFFSFLEKEQLKLFGLVVELGGQYCILVYLGEISQFVQDVYGLFFIFCFELGMFIYLYFEVQEGVFYLVYSFLLNLVRVEIDKVIVFIVWINQEGVEFIGYIGDLLANNFNFMIFDWIFLQLDGDVFVLLGDVVLIVIIGIYQIGFFNVFVLRVYLVFVQGEIFVEINELVMVIVFNVSGQLIWSVLLWIGV